MASKLLHGYKRSAEANILESVGGHVTEAAAILHGQSLTTAAQRTDVGDAMAFTQRQIVHASQATHVIDAKAVVQGQIVHTSQATHVSDAKAVVQGQIVHASQATHVELLNTTLLLYYCTMNTLL